MLTQCLNGLPVETLRLLNQCQTTVKRITHEANQIGILDTQNPSNYKRAYGNIGNYSVFFLISLVFFPLLVDCCYTAKTVEGEGSNVF